MLKTNLSSFGEVILPNEIFEETYQLIIGNIPAVGFRKKSEVGNGAIRIEINIKPKLNAFNIKIEINGIIFYIHQ